jgi:hypothetical protein
MVPVPEVNSIAELDNPHRPAHTTKQIFFASLVTEQGATGFLLLVVGVHPDLAEAIHPR